MIILIANLKGGSGKSTVAFNLALWMLGKGESVRALDLDPQATLYDVAAVRMEEGYKPVLDVSQDFSSLGAKGSFANAHLVIDVGAANMEGMRKSIELADCILIPVPPSQPDVWATQRFLHMVKEIRSGHMPELVAFVNRADTHCAVRESDDTESVLRQLQDVRVLDKRLCQRTIYRRSMSEGLGLLEMPGAGKAANEFDAFANEVFPYADGSSNVRMEVM